MSIALRVWCVLAAMLASGLLVARPAQGQPEPDEPGEGAKVRLLLTDALGQAQSAPFDAYDAEGWMVFEALDADYALRLRPGAYRLSPQGWSGLSVDVQVKGTAAVDVPLTVPDSVWLTFQLEEPRKLDAPADPKPVKQSRVLLAMRPRADMAAALRFALPMNDGGMRTLRAMRRPGLSAEQIAGALALCRKAVADQPAQMTGTRTSEEWTQLNRASEAAHRVLATFGDESDVSMLEQRLTQNKYPWAWDDAVATIALIEARLDALTGGRTIALLSNEQYGSSAALALCALGCGSVVQATVKQADRTTPPLWQLGAFGGRLLEADLALLRAWFKSMQQKSPEMLATSSPWSYATPAVVCLLAQGTIEDWRMVAQLPLGMGVLERLGVIAREVGPLARGAAELGMTWPTYGLSSSQRFGGDAAALAALDTVQTTVEAVFAAAKAGTDRAGNQNEYYWVGLVASAWTPNACSLEAYTKEWIEPTDSGGIAQQCEWNTHKPSWLRAANLVATGDFSWEVMADYVAPAEFKAAIEAVPADKRPYRSDVLVAAHAVCTRANMGRSDFMPMGVDRRAYVLRAAEGAIAGVLELRPEWRDDTLRLGLRIRQRANFMGGGLIDFHQGDITSYDHFGHASFPWMQFVRAVTLTRADADVALTRIGLSDDWWMTFEAPLQERSLRDLWLGVTLTYADQTIPLVFDVARSDGARLLRLAESDIAGARASLPSRPSAREVKSLGARLFAVGRCAEAWALIKPLAARDTGAAALAAAQFGALGDHARACEALTLITQSDPQNADAWYDLAVEQYLGRRYDAATDSIDHVLALDPSGEEAHWFKARLLVLRGRVDDARALLTTPPLAGFDEAEVRMLRFYCTMRASDADSAEGKARAKAAQDDMRAYAESFEDKSLERRFWVDAHHAWGGGDGERDCRTQAALCTYLTYRGYSFAAGNRTDLAVQALKRAVETSCTDMAEYRLAEALLGRLAKEPR